MPRYRAVPPKRITVATPVVEVPVVEAEPDLTTLKKDELVAEADKRGVDSSGTKAEILDRLRGEA